MTASAARRFARASVALAAGAILAWSAAGTAAGQTTQLDQHKRHDRHHDGLDDDHRAPEDHDRHVDADHHADDVDQEQHHRGEPEHAHHS